MYSKRWHCSQLASLCLASLIILQACEFRVLFVFQYTLFLKCYCLEVQSQELLPDTLKGTYCEV